MARWTDTELQFLEDNQDKDITWIVKNFPTEGRTIDSIKHKVERLSSPSNPEMPTVSLPPNPGRTFTELVDDLDVAYNRTRDHYEGKENIVVKMPGDKAVGILFQGDSHLGDPGTNIRLFMDHYALTKQVDGLYAVNLGDFVNNWVGRLGALYGSMPTTSVDERVLVEEFVQHGRLILAILGNHDKWSSMVEQALKYAGVATISHGGVMNIEVGDATFKVDIRHTHPGSSMYTPNFAQVKENFMGNNADIIVGAHIHKGAYSIVKNPRTGRVSHCLRVGPYKEYDDYADKNGWKFGEHIGPACIAVLDPNETSDHRVHVFHNLDKGIAFLGMLRDQ